MKKLEMVYRYILERYFTARQTRFTQLEIARHFSISTSTVHHALEPLVGLGMVGIQTRSFELTDAKKLVYYWATKRKLSTDIAYATRVNRPISELENEIPAGAIFTAYSAYRRMFNDAPADYSELYFYLPSEELEEARRRFPLAQGPPNVFVLKADKELREAKKVPVSQLLVDLWNLPQWYAPEFVKKLERRIFHD